MNKCTFISKRYIKGKKSCLAGSHWLSLLGIVIGVTALLIILPVMNGMRDVVIERILASSPELEVSLNPSDDYQEVYQTINNLGFVKYLNPTIEEDLIIFHNNETILTIVLDTELIERESCFDLEIRESFRIIPLSA